MTIGLRALVSGKVQGVGFRQSTARQARSLGVDGWVRNLPDGRVEAFLEGEESAVGALATWLEAGPPTARVSAVELSEAVPEGHPGFEIRA